MVNTYGLKMKGLKAASSDTQGLQGYFDPAYVQLNYNTETGEVLSNWHHDLGHNTWTQYHDPNIHWIGNLSNPTSMQEIADMIHQRMEELTVEQAQKARYTMRLR